MFEGSNLIAEDIYVYNNFISKEDLKETLLILDSFPEESWEKSLYSDFATSPILEKTKLFKEKIKNLFSDELEIMNFQCANRIKTNGTWGRHYDAHDFMWIKEMSKNYIEGSPYKEELFPVYGTVLYLNDFEGGELFYEKQNIAYKPSAGDLIIHSSAETHVHSVKKVLSEKRYSYSLPIWEKVKISL